MSTWNPSDTYSTGRPTLSNGNLTAVDSGGTTAAGIRGTAYQTSGKYYFEIDASASPPVEDDTERVFIVGIATSSYNLAGSSSTQVRALYVNLRHDTGIGYTSAGILTSGYDEFGNPTEDYDFGTYYAPETLAGFDTLGVAVDLDNHKIWFRDSNGWFFSGNPATGANPIWSNSSGDVNNFNAWTNVYPVLFTNRHTASKALAQTTANFGASTFAYTAPSGFVAWDVTPNLPTGNSAISITAQGSLSVSITWMSAANASLSVTSQGTLISAGVFSGNTDILLSTNAVLNATDTLLGTANASLDLSTTGNLTQPIALSILANLTFSLQGQLGQTAMVMASRLHTAIYGTPIRRLHEVIYGTSSLNAHKSSYESDKVQQLHEVSYSSESQRFQLHESLYASSANAACAAIHTTDYQSTMLAAAQTTHDSLWASLGTDSATAVHATSYQSTLLTEAFTTHSTAWVSLGTESVSALHSATWASLGTDSVSALHSTTWASLGTESAFTTHATTYQSALLTAAQTTHDSLYASLGTESVSATHSTTWASLGMNAVFAQHDVEWASLSAATRVFSLHETSWTVTPDILSLHSTAWKSVIAAQTLHHSRWQSEVDNFSFHEARYRSNTTTPTIQDGLVYVRV